MTALKMIYFTFIHSLMEYGLVFWGNQQKVQESFRYKRK